jgi:hypothetical protein
MRRMIQMTTNSKKMKVELEIDMDSLPELMKLLVEKQGDLKKVEPVVPSDYIQTITFPASGSGIRVSPYVPAVNPPVTVVPLPYTPDPNSTARPIGSPCFQCGMSGYPCRCCSTWVDPNIKFGSVTVSGDPNAMVIIRN